MMLRIRRVLPLLLLAWPLTAAGLAQDQDQPRLGVIEPFQRHFAQFGGGEGSSSDIVLTNPSSFFLVAGTISFFDAAGQALEIELADDVGEFTTLPVTPLENVILLKGQIKALAHQIRK